LSVVLAVPAGIPFPVVALFTLLQFSLLAGVWAFVTWAGIAGVAFPLLIVAIIPLRMFILPRLFGPHLDQLDEIEV
jgi:amino acid permease